MKKTIILTLAIILTSSLAFAQADYNRWSIDFGAGVNNPWKGMSTGYYTNDINFYTGDIGVRYMINEYFGLKADYGYNSFTNGGSSKAFDSDYMRTDLQVVVNAARVLNFEDWTKTIGLLLHTGGGFGWAHSDGYSGYDSSYNVLAGATVQFRLGNRVSLYLDGTAIMPTAGEDMSLDGWGFADTDRNSAIFNGTVGLSVYLGKQEQHADWYVKEEDSMKSMTDKYDDLELLISDIQDDQTIQNELNDINAQMDALAQQIDGKNGKNGMTYNEFVQRFSEDGFTSVFFDFNSAVIDDYSTTIINFLHSYLLQNPEAKVQVSGYTDNRGTDEYNKKLSTERAKAAAQVLIDSGIDASRVSYGGLGEDTSVDQNSEEAQRMSRRATFVIIQ